MSVDGTKIQFEGFLQKRKDTLKIRWVTYWFRLQNTTLFFYTKKNGSASHLRGYYYIYRVQSVREIQKTDRKPFLFEIVMTNGKRKMLAAETADLRKDWIGHLWQAMQLSSSGHFDAKVTEFEEYDQRERLNSDSVMEVAPARPLSTYSSSENIYAEAEDMTSPACPPEKRHSEEDIYQNIQRPLNSRNPNDPIVTDPQSSSEWSYRDEQENLYDVLPSRRSPCDARLAETHDVVYDFPQSYRTSAEPQDCIYDVPSCIQRSYNHSQDEQNQEETYWKI